MERPFPAYEGTEPFIFVCYAHDDEGLVYPEITRLRNAGFHIWYDEGISPGSEWSAILAERIQRCAVFLYFVTPRSVEREHCRQEVNFAQEQRCATLAVHLEKTAVPAALQLNLSHRQAILKFEHSRKAYEERLDRALETAALGRSETSDRTSNQLLSIGDWTLESASQRLTRGDESQVIDPKDLSVLLHLAEAVPDLVTTEALLDRNWPGMVVGDNALHQVIGRLRRAFGDDARKPRYIETLAKRGYRLMVPVAELPGAPQPAGIKLGAGESDRRRFPGRLASVATLTIFALLIGSWIMVEDRTRFNCAGDMAEIMARATVKVRSLRIVGGDPELQAFASVVELDLVDELSKTPVTVVSGSGEIGSSYALDGDLRHLADGRVLATLRVLRISDGILLWSASREIDSNARSTERFQYAPFFAHMTRSVVFMDQNPFIEGATDFAQREAIQATLSAVELMSGGEGDWLAVEKRYRAALANDPGLLGLHFDLGMAYKNRLGTALPYASAVETAHESARKVLAACPQWTFLPGTINSALDLDYEAAVANLEYARLNECCYTHGEVDVEIGWARLWQGNVEQALQLFETAKRLDPGTNRAGLQWATALAYLATDRSADALEVVNESETLLEGMSSMSIAVHVYRIKAQFLTGDKKSAETNLDETWSKYGEISPKHFPGVMALLGRNEHARDLMGQNELLFDRGELAVMSENFWGAYFMNDLELAFLWLDRTIENREFWFLPAFRHSRLLDPIRDHPRFIAAMTRLEEIEAAGSPIRSVAYP